MKDASVERDIILLDRVFRCQGGFEDWYLPVDGLVLTAHEDPINGSTWAVYRGHDGEYRIAVDTAGGPWSEPVAGLETEDRLMLLQHLVFRGRLMSSVRPARERHLGTRARAVIHGAKTRPFVPYSEQPLEMQA